MYLNENRRLPYQIELSPPTFCFDEQSISAVLDAIPHASPRILCEFVQRSLRPSPAQSRRPLLPRYGLLISVSQHDQNANSVPPTTDCAYKLSNMMHQFEQHVVPRTQTQHRTLDPNEQSHQIYIKHARVDLTPPIPRPRMVQELLVLEVQVFHTQAVLTARIPPKILRGTSMSSLGGCRRLLVC